MAVETTGSGRDGLLGARMLAHISAQRLVDRVGSIVRATAVGIADRVCKLMPQPDASEPSCSRQN